MVEIAKAIFKAIESLKILKHTQIISISKLYWITLKMEWNVFITRYLLSLFPEYVKFVKKIRRLKIIMIVSLRYFCKIGCHIMHRYMYKSATLTRTADHILMVGLYFLYKSAVLRLLSTILLPFAKRKALELHVLAILSNTQIVFE